MNARVNVGFYLRILVWVLKGARGDMIWMASKLQYLLQEGLSWNSISNLAFGKS